MRILRSLGSRHHIGLQRHEVAEGLFIKGATESANEIVLGFLLSKAAFSFLTQIFAQLQSRSKR